MPERKRKWFSEKQSESTIGGKNPKNISLIIEEN
jgi:hypothetical protein